MTDPTLAQQLRAKADALETQTQAQVAALRAAADALDTGGPTTSGRSARAAKGPKASQSRRGGEPRNPTPPAGKRAAHRAAVQAKLEALLAKEPTVSVAEVSRRLKIGFALAKELVQSLRPGG